MWNEREKDLEAESWLAAKARMAKCDAEAEHYERASVSLRKLVEYADEIERLRKDAERYRWLRCRANPAPMVFMRHPDGSLRWRGALHGDGLDAAIDDAMALPLTK